MNSLHPTNKSSKHKTSAVKTKRKLIISGALSNLLFNGGGQKLGFMLFVW